MAETGKNSLVAQVEGIKDNIEKQIDTLLQLLEPYLSMEKYDINQSNFNDIGRIDDIARKLKIATPQILESKIIEQNLFKKNILNYLAKGRHDLCDFINSIQGYSEIVKEDFHNSKQFKDADHFQKVIQTAKSILNYINQLKDIRPNIEESPSLFQREHFLDLKTPSAPEKTMESTEYLYFKDNFAILIVDDNEANCQLLEKYLKMIGYKNTHIVHNGFEAVANKNKFDLILLDIEMPGMSGIDVLKELRENIIQRQLMVLMISASDSSENIIECIRLGAEDFLPKPFDKELLQVRIGSCIEKKWFSYKENVYREHLRFESTRYEKLLNSIFPPLVVQEIVKTGKIQTTYYNNIDEILNVYNYNNNTTPTTIYGVIGDPLTKSLGHIAYNSMMNSLNLAGVYVKFPVSLQQLEYFIQWAKQIGIKGLSVTMPLKEKVVPYLDEIDISAKKIKSVNNLTFIDNKIIGANTDGRGGLDAIEEKMKVSGKKVIILGGGGAGIALANEAQVRGATIIVIEQDEIRAKYLGELFNCQWGGLNTFKDVYQMSYDILINATPSQLPIDPELIIPGTLVMDVSMQPKMTTLLTHAKNKGCTLVFGYQMFINQAIMQTQNWFGGKINITHAQEVMQKIIEQYMGFQEEK